jgi:hypothetical protein
LRVRQPYPGLWLILTQFHRARGMR